MLIKNLFVLPFVNTFCLFFDIFVKSNLTQPNG